MNETGKKENSINKQQPRQDSNNSQKTQKPSGASRSANAAQSQNRASSGGESQSRMSTGTQGRNQGQSRNTGGTQGGNQGQSRNTGGTQGRNQGQSRSQSQTRNTSGTQSRSQSQTRNTAGTQSRPVSQTRNTAGTQSRNTTQNKRTTGETPNKGVINGSPINGEGKSVNSKQNHSKSTTKSLKVIPLGGLKEIGKNMTAFEYGEEILIVDCGMSFPDNEMFGIDVVIPDFEYLIENKKKIKGLIITHGHEDHIGGIPYLLKKLNVPVYGTRLPIALIEGKLEEHKIKGKMNVIKAGEKFKLGAFKITAIRTNHSIADSLCFAIDTPVGTVFHTGDFKIDYTPVDGEPIDFGTLAKIGEKGVLLLMADSTNAARPGFTASEKVVGKALGEIFRESSSRIIVATFSSNVHRMQKIIDNAVKCNRKVVFSGRSMVKVAGVATELGYLDIPAGAVLDLAQIKNYPDKELVIITTGSQGEPMSALARMANSTHRDLQIKKGDMVILSSTPVPGNEKTVSNVMNKLIEKGAQVIFSDIAETHVSGHACAEELKIVHSLIKPKYFMPVHGEERHLRKHSDLAIDLGMAEERIFILENGDMLTINDNEGKITKEAASNEIIMVDGLGVGDVGTVVLRDRKLLSESGLITVVVAIEKGSGNIISGPDLVSRGFVYVKENEDLISQAKEVTQKSLDKCKAENIRDWSSMRSLMRDDLRKFIYGKTRRNPIILPIFMEV